MIDFNAEAEKILSRLDCEVVFQYPQKFSKLPVVSYYTLTENVAMRADNEELIQEGYLQIDIWCDKPCDCGRLAVEINTLMENGGWTRQFSMDQKREQGDRIYHRTMRFAKIFC